MIESHVLKHTCWAFGRAWSGNVEEVTYMISQPSWCRVYVRLKPALIHEVTTQAHVWFKITAKEHGISNKSYLSACRHQNRASTVHCMKWGQALNSPALLIRPQTIPSAAPPTSDLSRGPISQNWKHLCGCAVCSSVPVNLQKPYLDPDG